MVPAPTDARRANALLCAPPKWGLRPHDPYGEGAPPLHPRGILQGRKSLLLQCRRSALHPGDFLPDEKVTKESPRGVSPLGTPLRGTLRSPCSTLCCYPLKRVCATKIDRFATLRWWANRSLLFPLALTRKNILLLIRGAGAFSCTFGCNFWGDSGYR